VASKHALFVNLNDGSGSKEKETNTKLCSAHSGCLGEEDKQRETALEKLSQENSNNCYIVRQCVVV